MDTAIKETSVTEAKINNEIVIYQGASTLIITDQEQEKLLASFETDQIEIRPDGMIYLPQTFWRKRLNEAFGIAQWCIVPKASTKDPDRNKLYFQGVLMIRGHFVAEAVGEAEYHETNSNQSWASVWESAKSDCITRCCKDLGIASELWQPQFITKWIEENAVKVWVKPNRNSNDKKVSWRKKGAKPYWNEVGEVPADDKRHETQPPAPPPPVENPFIKNYTEAKAIEAVLALAKTDGDLYALYKSNSALIEKDRALHGKFTARKKEILGNASAAATQAPPQAPAQPPAQSAPSQKKQKPALNGKQLIKLLERLEVGDISVHEKAFRDFVINQDQKTTLDDAYQKAMEFERVLRTKYAKPEDIIDLLPKCKSIYQVRAMTSSNEHLTKGNGQLLEKISERIEQLK